MATEQPRKGAREQEDVLEHKDHVTSNARGLQVWGDEFAGTDQGRGNASEGTAERAGRITKGQKESED